MSTTNDTFIYLKRDIEQSFQRVQTLSNSSHYHHQELDQLLNHISCTLDDLQKVNHLLQTSEDKTNSLPERRLTVSFSKENDESSVSSNSNLIDEREEFLQRMKSQYEYFKNKFQSTNKDAQMEIIRLDQETEDQILRRQDEQLEDFHHSIVSLKNLTQNINFEINDHIKVLDNLETSMVNSHNRVENLTNRTKNFLRSSGDGIGGHTCLFCTAVILFFLIVILIIFF